MGLFHTRYKIRLNIKVEKMKTIFVKPAEVERNWFIIDAKDVTLGKVAVKAAMLLRGKHKACYTPHQEVGDYVIIINAEFAALSANKKKDKTNSDTINLFMISLPVLIQLYSSEKQKNISWQL